MSGNENRTALVANILRSLAGLPVDPPDPHGDNLSILLCSYFEDHPDCPEDGPLDDFDCWPQWACDRCDDLLRRIAEAAAATVSPMRTDKGEDQ
ncbi:MAG: hypothetical protein RBS99_16720 [Rhodospirillales bacterium]|jgi:hypothetical protein|nr:hypothetical protein [Rhodospirillales bacterium]